MSSGSGSARVARAGLGGRDAHGEPRRARGAGASTAIDSVSSALRLKVRGQPVVSRPEVSGPSVFVQSRAPTTKRTASGKRQSRMALRHMLAAREGLTPPVRGSGHASARAGYEFRRANLVNPQDNTPPPCQGPVALVDCCNQLTKKKSSGALMARHVASLKSASLNSRSE